MASGQKTEQKGGGRVLPPAHRLHRYRRHGFGSRRVAVLAVVVVAAGMVAIYALRMWQPEVPTPVVVLPENLSSLDRELIELIERHAAAVEESPRDARRHATLGLVYEANLLWPEARRCFATATQLDPSQPIWAYHAAKAADEVGDDVDALDRLRAAAEVFPDFAPIHYRFGDLLLARGDLEAAAEAFERTCQLQPDAAETLTNLADVRLRMGRYAEAATLLEKAVKLDYAFGTAQHLLGRAYQALGRDAEAQKQTQLAQQCKDRPSATFHEKRYLKDAWEALLPRYVRSVSLRIRNVAPLIDAGRSEEAITELELLRAGHPDNTRVLDKLGIAYMQVGRIDDALHTLLSAKKIHDGSKSISLNLATCWLLRHKPESALKEIDHTIELAPKMWKAHYTRGLALMELARFPEARDALLNAVDRRPNYPMVYTKLADACAATERLAEARDYYETAVRNWPRFVPASIGLAKISIRLEEWNRALDALATARRAAPNDPRVVALGEQMASRVAQ